MKPNKINSVNWFKDAIIYQIFPDRFFNGDNNNDPKNIESWGNPPTRINYFGGDLQGIINKIDYLHNLGINSLYLNPIFKADTNHKYDTIDYYEIDPSFGDFETINNLITEAHKKNIKIILDGVFNHCGIGFHAFVDLIEKKEKSKYVDWFKVRYFPINSNPLNYFTFGGCHYLPKFNHSNPEVKKYLFDVAIYWLNKFGIDGWRLDVPFRIPKSFWKEFRKTVKCINPNCYLVGEMLRDASEWVKGDIFDGCTNYQLRELIISFFSKGKLDAEDFSYELNSLLSRLGNGSFYMMNLLGCHDTPRIRTIFKGEDTRLAMAIIFQFTFVGIPLIYYGDEIGLNGKNDPDCRRTMEWDRKRWNRNIFDIYKTMIKLRNQYISLRRGSFETLLTFDKLIAYKRVYEDEEFISILNPGPSVIKIHIPTESKSKIWFDVLSKGNKYSTENGKLYFSEVEPDRSILLCNKLNNKK